MNDSIAASDRNQSLVPETRVLAIASHVAYGFVGNTMATFVMQALGCEVAAINTVHYSNHAGYHQLKGTKTGASDILDIYKGLQQSNLDCFDMMLTGYVPTADGLESIGTIAKDLKLKNPGVFWILDPVMGDQGQLYVSGEEVPIYRSLLHHADLILPNQFELELLAGQPTNTLPSIASAIEKLHRTYGLPHVIVTSLLLDSSEPNRMTVIGSSRKSDHSSRLFQIGIPALPCFFAGTGDMFAALMVGRLREAVEGSVQSSVGWIPQDSVSATDLPLARATEKVLASMQSVLAKTYECMTVEMASHQDKLASLDSKEHGQQMHLLKTRASEVRVVRNVGDLIHPTGIDKFRAVPVSL